VGELIFCITIKRERKKMELKKYMTPEMEVVELKNQLALLSSSPGEETAPGTGDYDEL
jgi:hypothetical protein